MLAPPPKISMHADLGRGNYSVLPYHLVFLVHPLSQVLKRELGKTVSDACIKSAS